MSKFTTKSGIGYYEDSEGRIISKYNIPQGEHKLPENADKAVDVESETELSKIEIDVFYQSGGESLLEAKSKRINMIKDIARSVLSKTDWYIIRKQETGKEIPDKILSHRQEVRSLTEKAEKKIESLKTVEAVCEYSPDFPEPPKTNNSISK